MEGNDRKQWLEYEKRHRHRVPRKLYPNFTQKEQKCEPFHLQHPFTCMVSGMTGCGKTTWVQKMLEQRGRMIVPPPQRIVWCYSRWQSTYTEMLHTIPGIEFVKGIPSHIERDDYFDVHMNNLIVIDDQMSTASNNKQVINLFTQGSHHRNLSVIYLVQNLFHQGKGNRDISLNCHYLVIFKNPRDQLQVLTLAKQMYPGNTSYFFQKYEEAVSRPFGYLLIDLKTITPDHCRLRTNVLSGEEPQKEDSSEDKVSKELMKYLKQQSLALPPTASIVQNLQDQMGDILKSSNLNVDQKVRQYTQLQNDFLQYKKKLNSSLHPPTLTLSSSASIPSVPSNLVPASVPTVPSNLAPASVPTVPSNLAPASVPTVPTNSAPEQMTPISLDSHGGMNQPHDFQNPVTPSFQSNQHATPYPLTTQIPEGILTPPPSSSPGESKRKRPRYDLIKNYLDDDAHKVQGPYLKAYRTRRSTRIQNRHNPLFD